MIRFESRRSALNILLDVPIHLVVNLKGASSTIETAAGGKLGEWERVDHLYVVRAALEQTTLSLECPPHRSHRGLLPRHKWILLFGCTYYGRHLIAKHALS